LNPKPRIRGAFFLQVDWWFAKIKHCANGREIFCYQEWCVRCSLEYQL